MLQGTTKKLNAEIYFDPAFTDLKVSPISVIQYECEKENPPTPFQIANTTAEPICIQGIYLWRNSISEVNDELYKGYLKGNSKMELNEFAAAYDFSDSDETKFNVTIWYNGTSEMATSTAPPLLRVPRLVNLVSNAYLKNLLGPEIEMHFEFVKEMPKHETKFRFDLTSLLGTLFFTWIILQLFPVVLTSIVYEKQQRLRLMMKMHGLGDGPYWMITYTYFLAISLLYMFCFVLFGSLIGLKVFLRNSYGIQFVFYFLFINLQIAVAFLLAAFFSHVKTAAVTAYICVFASGLLGSFLFESFIENKGLPREWIYILELYPGFSLYRGIYEFEMYAFTMLGAHGMQWGNLNDPKNGMKDVLIIIIVECIVVLVIAFYLDQVSSSGGGKSPLFFLQKFRKKSLLSFQTQGSSAGVDMEKHDVSQERDRVEQLIRDNSTSHSVIVNNLKKVYAGEDGNPDKFAVRGLSLALPQAECFGMLGPNGAGKTSFISMMIGLTKPTSGQAIVNGYDLQTEMDNIYTNIGVCPQFDLLWESLTGREHLLFYGRLKNLKGSALNNAVEESLRGVNLLSGGVADKFAGTYSGGMKRRLSVAISLIGDPKVVYLDEPSTGLDPASRNSLWDVVKQAKQGRAIILTTHSMEEAEALCDRLGIFVDGSLQCIGNPKELKGRYGGFYVFTMTTSADHEKEVERLVHQLSPDANKIYHLSGTQKFELPKQDVNIAQVFQAVEKAKSMFTVFAWGLADTTLEDVFIKVAQAALDAANA